MLYWLDKMMRIKRESGAVMPLFAFCLLPILVLAAMVVDLTRIALINTELAYACDAASIAAVRYNSTDATTNATGVFYANYKNGLNGVNLTPTVTVSSDNSYVDVSAQAPAPLFFSKLLGNKIP